MLRHLVGSVAPQERAALEPDVERLGEQVARLSTPAGELAKTCDRLAAGLEKVLPRLAETEWNEGRARDLLAALATDRAYLEAADRESAEQAALAVQSLVAYLSNRRPAVARGPLPGQVRALFAALDDPGRYDRVKFGEVLGGVAAAVPQR